MNKYKMLIPILPVLAPIVAGISLAIIGAAVGGGIIFGIGWLGYQTTIRLGWLGYQTTIRLPYFIFNIFYLPLWIPRFILAVLFLPSFFVLGIVNAKTPYRHIANITNMLCPSFDIDPTASNWKS